MQASLGWPRKKPSTSFGWKSNTIGRHRDASGGGTAPQDGRTTMRILALEPYCGGSHKAFLDGWSAASGHEWTVFPLPPYKWKWRMRHAAVTFAEMVAERASKGLAWDVLFCSDMLNLAEFLGLAPVGIRNLPSVVYFHENQLTYPVRFESERDYQFAMTNMTTALAADAVWFNSAFHRDSFLAALGAFLKRMPDHQCNEAAEKIKQKASVHPPGVGSMPSHRHKEAGPPRILWAARWEHDKNPQTFFDALKLLKRRGAAFRLSVIGEQFRDKPEVFDRAHRYFADHIDRWGYQPNRTEYETALSEADVFVSTAEHEFFGLSAVEAALAGAYPLLPKRLAYPEIFGPEEDPGAKAFFYDGGSADLADKLNECARRLEAGASLGDLTQNLRQHLRRFQWPLLAPILDEALERLGSDPIH